MAHERRSPVPDPIPEPRSSGQELEVHPRGYPNVDPRAPREALVARLISPSQYVTPNFGDRSAEPLRPDVSQRDTPTAADLARQRERNDEVRAQARRPTLREYLFGRESTPPRDQRSSGEDAHFLGFREPESRNQELARRQSQPPAVRERRAQPPARQGGDITIHNYDGGVVNVYNTPAQQPEPQKPQGYYAPSVDYGFPLNPFHPVLQERAHTKEEEMRFRLMADQEKYDPRYR